VESFEEEDLGSGEVDEFLTIRGQTLKKKNENLARNNNRVGCLVMYGFWKHLSLKA